MVRKRDEYANFAKYVYTKHTERCGGKPSSANNKQDTDNKQETGHKHNERRGRRQSHYIMA